MTTVLLSRLCVAWLVAAFAMASAVSSTQSAEKIKIGYVSTLSGSLGVSGTNVRDGFMLGLDHVGGKIGGLHTEVLVEDDQFKPDVARQIINKFLEFNKVDVVTGILASNVMMAIHPAVTGAKTILISPNAGPSPIAAEQCSEYFFSTSWQGDNFAEAMGAYLQEQGKQNIYLMAPNYQAGRDVIAGFKRFFKGRLAGEVYTPVTQLDFSAELAQLRAANPSAVFAVYPGGLGIQFVRQYAQAGLKEKFPLYTSYTIDDTNVAAIGEAGVGVTITTMWSADLTNDANRKFVSDFVLKYGYPPSNSSAQGYDAARLLDSAVRKVGGKIEDKPAFIAALKEADFKSVRGNFRFNSNHFPIQDFYLAEIVKNPDGSPSIKLRQVAFKDHGDAYASKCPLK